MIRKNSPAEKMINLFIYFTHTNLSKIFMVNMYLSLGLFFIFNIILIIFNIDKGTFISMGSAFCFVAVLNILLDEHHLVSIYDNFPVD